MATAEQVKALLNERLSHAEIARACDDAAKDCILHDHGHVKSTSLIAMLQERRQIERASGAALGQMFKRKPRNTRVLKLEGAV